MQRHASVAGLYAGASTAIHCNPTQLPSRFTRPASSSSRCGARGSPSAPIPVTLGAFCAMRRHGGGGWGNLTSISASFVTARMPNTFCASPLNAKDNCGAFDLLLLFRADVAIWEKACATTLHDACGFLTVGRDSRRCLAGDSAGFFDCPRSAAGMGMLCSTGKPRGRESERTRHLHGLAGRCELPSRGRSVERASLNFHAACAGNDTTAPFRTPTCQLPGVNFPDVKEP